jgi:hypothetical protein
MSQSEKYEFDSIVYTQFVIDAGQMVFDGVLADAERARDIFVGLTVDECGDDLSLARC